MAITKNSAFTLSVPFPDTGLTITATVRKDSGDFAASTNSCAELGTTRVYEIDLTAAEMNAEKIDVLLTPNSGTAVMATIVTDGTATATVSASTISAIADAVWDETMADHSVVNTSTGYNLSFARSAAHAANSNTSTILSRLTSTRATLLDNLDAAISTRLATSSYTAPDNNSITSILTAVNKVLKWFTNKRVVTPTSQKLYDDDNTTVLFNQSITADGNTATRGKAV